MAESPRASAAEESRPLLGAGLLLITALVAWRVSGWESAATANWWANAALLWSLWTAWLFVLRAVESLCRRWRPAKSHGWALAILVAGVILPEMAWRAHLLGSKRGWAPSRMGIELLVSAAILSLVVVGLLRLRAGRVVDSRPLLVVMVLGLISGGVRDRGPAPDPRLDDRPNVLLVVVDALRADALGCYGNPLTPTPRIDELASRGWRFEHAFSTATTSVPGHASILWGMSPFEHRALSNEFDVPTDLRTPLSQELRSRGYRSFAVCQNPLVSASSGFGQGFDHYWSWFEPDMAHAGPREVLWQFAVTRSVLELLGVEPISTRALWQMRQGEPWMGFVQFLYTHDPYQDRDGWSSAARIDAIEARLTTGELENTTSYPTREVAEFVASYYGAAAYVDRLVGKLVDRVDGLDRETLVVVTADHGENLAEHGDDAIAKHFGWYQSSLRVPWILTSTRHALPEVHPELTGVDRIASTLLEWVDGTSVAARGVPAKRLHLAYSRPLLVAMNDSLKAVVDGDDLTALPRIFRWRSDPLDRRGLDATTAMADTLVELQAQIAPLLLDPTASMRPEKLQRLRALGYIE